MHKREYRNYDPEIKRQIMESGNPNLFPDLNIPRSTLRYWIERARPVKSRMNVDKSLYDKILKLEKDLRKEREKVLFLQKHLEIAGKIERSKLKEKSKKLIIENLVKFKDRIGINRCLKLIALPRGSYERWLMKHYCKRTRSYLCAKSRGNQLTYEEQIVLKKMASSKRYFHMPIKSLHLFCLRRNILSCSLDTWYKYVQLFRIERPNVRKKLQKRYGIGIRAQTPNQIWHVDVTQVKLQGGKKVYVQAIIDNRSRYIVAWNVAEVVSAQQTIKTINKALQQSLSPGALMMDGGTENTNMKVKKVLIHKNITRIISKKDVRWSNSIIEALFRSLKNNFLYSKVCTTVDELKRKLGFYFKEHNEIVPHNSLGGAVPAEVYHRIWTRSMGENLLSNVQAAMKKRIQVNRNFLCCKS